MTNLPVNLQSDSIPTGEPGSDIVVTAYGIEPHAEGRFPEPSRVEIHQRVEGRLHDEPGIVLDEQHLRSVGLRFLAFADDIVQERNNARFRPVGNDMLHASVTASKTLEDVMISDGEGGLLSVSVERVTYADVVLATLAGGPSYTQHVVVLQQKGSDFYGEDEPRTLPIRIDEGSLLDLIASLTDAARLISLSHVNRNMAMKSPITAAEFDPMLPDPDIALAVDQLGALVDRLEGQS